MPVKVSTLMPIHSKPLDTVQAVLKAAKPSNGHETIIVLDRASQAIQDAARAITGAIVKELTGPPGWRSPCFSFNAALSAATGEICLLNQSDVVQMSGTLDVIAKYCNDSRTVHFGHVAESAPHELQGNGNAGPILMASYNTRPMTFLTAVPTWALKEIGGWDEAYQAGVCYEDDDLMVRLWNLGLDFVWDDRISGVHMTHNRAYFKDEPVAINLGLFLSKYGTSRFWDRELQLGRIRVIRNPGRTEWLHA